MKHALFSGTRNLYGDMETAAKSLVAHSDVGKVWFLIEDAAYPGELPDIIETVDVSGQAFFPPDGANMRSPFSYMAMMRAALALMPEFDALDRILALDCDIVCKGDVSGIWELPIDGRYFSAAPEPIYCVKGLRYCNIGVTLYNLGMLRDGKAAEVIHALNVQHFPNVEQDAFSYLCQGRIHEMPSMYNSCWYTDKYAPGSRIVHFAGVKHADWSGRPEFAEWRETPWDRVMGLHEGLAP